ncbi:hypothetical protein [Terribacillus saccharophilus]|uniref:hypothetical protein n=1 Tax=Terribacillus saccharophilus TaxID=361277 RepID=UPI0015CF14D3|nr:hypothetical protein [Terribacillus saccharophilus]
MAYVIMREVKDDIRCSTMCKLFDTIKDAELMKKQLVSETASHIHWFIVEM